MRHKCLVGLLLTTVLFNPVKAIEYEGAFAPAKSENGLGRFTGSELNGGMTFSKNCFGKRDPTPDDGFPGCLGMLGNAKAAPYQFGAFSVPKPKLVPAHNRNKKFYQTNAMARADLVIDILDPSLRSSGSSIFQEIVAMEKKAAARKKFKNRALGGLAELPDGSLLFACGYDWYNVARTNFPTHCLTRLDNGTPNAVGPFNFECGDESSPYLCGTSQVAEYVASVDQKFADSTFSAKGSAWCFTGMHRTPGFHKKESQGASLYAFPCDDLFKRPNGGTINAIPILHSQSKSKTKRKTISIEPDLWPGNFSRYKWTPNTKARAFVWGSRRELDGSVADGLFVVVHLGGPIWWYGKPDPYSYSRAHRNGCRLNYGSPITKKGVDCQSDWSRWGAEIPRGLTDRCQRYKGYHSMFGDTPNYRTTVLFYRSQDLAASAKKSITGSTWDHLGKVPFQVVEEFDDFEGLWNNNCQRVRGIAHDPHSGRFFLLELFGTRPIIHVFSTDVSR